MKKKQILTYLIDILHSDKLKHIESLEQKIQLYEPSGETGSPDNAGILLNKESALAYMDAQINQVEGLTVDQQKNYLSPAAG